MLVVIGTDYTDSGKSNYHTIKTTIALKNFRSQDNLQLTQDKTKAVTDRNVGSGLGQALNVTVLKHIFPVSIITFPAIKQSFTRRV